MVLSRLWKLPCKKLKLLAGIGWHRHLERFRYSGGICRRAATFQISRAANAIAACLAGGGRHFYAGAGTSIRIGVQDGSELSATFGMAEDKIDYLIAGGRAAMFETLADAEDDAVDGARGPEHMTLGGAENFALTGIVDIIERLGESGFAHVRLPSGQSMVAEVRDNPGVRSGDAVRISLEAKQLHFFDEHGHRMI